MPPIFRDATRADIGTILKLCHDGAIEPARYPDEDEHDPGVQAGFQAIENDPNHRLIVAELDGEVVGVTQISYLPGLPTRGLWRGQLENVHIRADMRGKNIGSQMINWCIDQCRTRGCGIVQFTSNQKRTDARRFYERLGFSVTHNGFKLTL